VTRPARILLVDDEPSIQKGLRPLLASRGYEVDSAMTGAAALRAFDENPPDLIVLDLGLPDLEGGEVCRRVRTTSQLPIIVLSARGGDADKIAALDQGADDYVTKPFSPEELLARIRVALRRVFGGAEPTTGRVQRGDLTIDFDRRRVLRQSTEIRLTPKEFELLAFLARHPNRVLTHHTILTTIWGNHAAAQPEHLWVLIGQLRKKLERDASHPRYLISEPWVGYRFVVDDETDRSDR
jgi:two-component system KDP operon response regulator KdpE